MRLEIRINTPNAPKGPAPFTLEHGTRTLGRSRDCDWQLNANDRTISKRHCTVKRIRDGYALTDESANGTQVDGKTLLEGQAAPLRDGSAIVIGGSRLVVRVHGELEEDLPDQELSGGQPEDTLTISAILADAVPGGRMASGILGRKEAPEEAVNSSKAVPASKGISRNVQLGWDSPPAPASEGGLLPENWNEDEGPDSGLGVRTEHAAAPSTAVFISRTAARPQAAAPAEAQQDDPDPVFPQTAGAEAPGREPQPQPAAGPDFSRLRNAVSALERTSSGCFTILGFDALEIRSGGFPAPEENLAARIEQLARNQSQFADMLANMLSEATRRLEPRLIEARQDETLGHAQRLLPPLSDAGCWKAYKRQLESDGRALDITEFLQKAASGQLPGLDVPGRLTPETKEAKTPDEA